MKAILTRLFNHEELTSEETKQILLNITKEMYPEAQIAALLTAFQMRSITVDELIGFREALMETRAATERTPSTSPPALASWWREPATRLPSTATTEPLP
mgnify:CR=1 FL=1